MRIETRNSGTIYNVHNKDINADGSFIIPTGVTNIGYRAFYSCNQLASVVIPDTVTNIEIAAFHGCTGLTSVTLPNSITRIGSYAFVGCSKLKSKPDNYKAFSLTETGKLKCLNKTYTVGKKSMARGDLIPCANGLHYCTNLFDIFNYYHGEYGKDFVIGICEVSRENFSGFDDSKRCARWVRPMKILTREEVIGIMNGDENDES